MRVNVIHKPFFLGGGDNELLNYVCVWHICVRNYV